MNNVIKALANATKSILIYRGIGGMVGAVWQNAFAEELTKQMGIPWIFADWICEAPRVNDALKPTSDLSKDHMLFTSGDDSILLFVDPIPDSMYQVVCGYKIWFDIKKESVFSKPQEYEYLQNTEWLARELADRFRDMYPERIKEDSIPAELITAVTKVCAASRDVINSHAIDTFVAGRVKVLKGLLTDALPEERIEQILSWLKASYRKYLINRYPGLTKLSEYLYDQKFGDVNDPIVLRRVLVDDLGIKSENLIQQLLASENFDTYFVFEAKKLLPVDKQPIQMLRLATWFLSKEAPKNIEKLSIEIARDQSTEYKRRLMAKPESSLKAGEDFKVVSSSGSYRWVQLLSAECLAIQGQLSKDCSLAYVAEVASNRKTILALWDKEKIAPHISIDVIPGENGWVITQIEGVANSQPKVKYFSQIKDIIDELKHGIELNGIKITVTEIRDRYDLFQL